MNINEALEQLIDLKIGMEEIFNKPFDGRDIRELLNSRTIIFSKDDIEALKFAIDYLKLTIEINEEKNKNAE